jgi:hypothetical protein
MSDFDDIAERLAQLKREQDAREAAAKQDSAAAFARFVERQDELMAEHVVPVLREAQESLGRGDVPTTLDLERNYPTFAKELHVGQAGMALRHFILRVESESGQFKIIVEGTRRRFEVLYTNADGVRPGILKAYGFLLEEWLGLRTSR